jgi:hypothetical protein
MRCDEAERLLERSEEELTADEIDALDAHLRDCPVCGGEAAEEGVAEAVRLDAEADELPDPEAFLATVHAGIREAARRGRRRGLAFVGAGALTAAAAALLLVAALSPGVPVRVDRTEGGLLALTGEGRWMAVAEGDVLRPGGWSLTFPGRRALLRARGARVLLHGDSLASVAPGEMNLLRGKALVESGGDPFRVRTPFGAATGRRASFVLDVRYERDPVIRIESEGTLRRGRSLLLLAALAGPAGRSESGPPPEGSAEVTVLRGEVTWKSGGDQGVLRAGETIRLRPGRGGEKVPAGEDAADGWMEQPFATAEPVARGADAVDELLRDLEAKEAKRRIRAAERLGRLGSPGRVTERLVDRLERETSPAVLAELLLAVRRTAPPRGEGGEAARRSRGAIERTLHHVDPAVRDAALRCWVETQGTSGIEEVGATIDDPEPELRILALVGLRVLRDPRGRPWAEKALEDPDPAVAEEARRAVEALEGEGR